MLLLLVELIVLSNSILLLAWAPTVQSLAPSHRRRTLNERSNLSPRSLSNLQQSARGNTICESSVNPCPCLSTWALSGRRRKPVSHLHAMGSLSESDKRTDVLMPTIATTLSSDTKEAGPAADYQKSSIEKVPSTLWEAIGVFLVGGYCGPRLVIAALVGMVALRLQLALTTVQPISLFDAGFFGLMVVLWWLQEHVMHKHLLHSSWDWYGKTIHQQHHDRPYMHISIDDASLMLGWFLVVHVLLRLCLPWHLALSATLGYALAGLYYEWAHYIVHTNVSFPRTSYWYRMKQHHIRHHLVDSNYWFGFSVPAVDSLFGTNPSLKEVKHRKQETCSQ